MTKRLYDEDAYIREFEAQVISCTEGKAGYEVVLDRTAFFPEGGGQPADQGRLGEAVVTDVRDKKDHVLHICDRPLQEGSRVHGEIDWDRRFLHMQQHSGEHAFSGIVHGMYGYDNIGFHMGKDGVTVDFSGLLSEDEIREAERRANAAVLADLEILAEYPSGEALASLDYRSKKEIDGDIRIVTVPGADVCACCGTHVRRTGEIGPIKAVSCEHYKSGVRILLQIGSRALEDYDTKHRNIKEISALLSVKPEQTADAVRKLQEQFIAQKNACAEARERLIAYQTAEIPEGCRNAVFFETDMNAVEVRKLADSAADRAELAAVFSGSDRDGYQYVMCSRSMDMAALGKQFREALGGRGGGRNPMIQGSVQAPEEDIRDFIDRIQA